MNHCSHRIQNSVSLSHPLTGLLVAPVPDATPFQTPGFAILRYLANQFHSTTVCSRSTSFSMNDRAHLSNDLQGSLAAPVAKAQLTDERDLAMAGAMYVPLVQTEMAFLLAVS
jgi:hypothetical protein